jgi:hypothetical protein
VVLAQSAHAGGSVALCAVAQHDLDAWQTDAPGPFVTIRAGGPLEGVVTLTAIEGGHGRTLVEARWTKDGDTQTASVEVESHRQGRTVAHSAAADLAAGHARPSAPREFRPELYLMPGPEQGNRPSSKGLRAASRLTRYAEARRCQR